MRDIDRESLKRWKDSFAKEGIIYDSDEKYYEAIHNLTSFLDKLVEIDMSLKNSTQKDIADKMYLLDSNENKIIL